jgi:putative ABC transport system permease protein
VGIAALGLVIGGLSVANTVAAAVFERLRDFGIKRALGATDAQLGREVLGEALAVTGSGGLAGIILAIALGVAIDQWSGVKGQQLFLFSLRLVGGALLFSVLLGGLAALYATLRVARLSPAEAMRRGA